MAVVLVRILTFAVLVCCTGPIARSQPALRLMPSASAIGMGMPLQEVTGLLRGRGLVIVEGVNLPPMA